METIFELRHDVDVIFNYAASSTLAFQINQGAPVDVFASADVDTMLDVQNEENIQIFAMNRLVVINSNPDIQTLEDLATRDYLLVLTGEEVPAGKYARQVLVQLEGLYGSDFSEKVLEHLVSNEANVHQAATKVALGEADVSIVYVTDAQALENVQSITIPVDYNVLADYPIAVLSESQSLALAEVFVDFVLSKEGQEILERYGFIKPY
jgi:molybdate transport system substrate-binding protein